MLTFLLRRLLLAVPLLIGSSLVVFAIFNFSNVDPVRRMLGEKSQNEALVQKMRGELGLNDPAHVRYWRFISGVFKGDFGLSIATREPVTKELRHRFPATLELAGTALVLSIGFGLFAGVLSALRKNRFEDFAAMGISLIGVSMPVFWVGLLLTYFFSERFGWFPLQGRYALTFSGEVETRTGVLIVDTILARNWGMLRNVLHHLVLPAVTLAAVTSALVARMTRSSVLEVLNQDYVRTAAAKGLGFLGQLRHVLRNALIPVVTIIGLEVPALLGGAVITETIFSWPGMGKYLVDSILSGDILAVQGTVMFLTLIYIVVNLMVDVVYALIDPRMRAAVTEEG